MEKKLINPDFAIKIIKSGYPIKNKELEGKLDLLVLEVNYEINEQIIIEDSIIDELFSWGAKFKKRVIFRNSVFQYVTMFQAAYFYGGLTIENCIFENLVDFSCGGHNLDNTEIIIENNIFKKFVDFDDCLYEGPFIMKNNNFEEGTNLLGEWQLNPSFEELPIIENNKGELKLIELPKPYSDYYTRAEEIKEQSSEKILVISQSVSTVEQGIDSFIKAIETFEPEDKIIFIEDQLKTLKEAYNQINDKGTKKFIEILERIKENNN